jgi:hypothetical protein
MIHRKEEHRSRARQVCKPISTMASFGEDLGLVLGPSTMHHLSQGRLLLKRVRRASLTVYPTSWLMRTRSSLDFWEVSKMCNSNLIAWTVPWLRLISIHGFNPYFHIISSAYMLSMLKPINTVPTRHNITPIEVSVVVCRTLDRGVYSHYLEVLRGSSTV